jgi:4'-phosphopantetheinyl transferase
MAPMRDWLSPEERERAVRFRFDRHRDDYIFHHATLRRILAGYLGVNPAIGANALGKPVLCAGGLHFNMSHCGPVGLYAVAARELGVDVERIRPMPDAAPLAARFFTPAERDAIGSDEDAFFTCWTRKEAILKAAGDGLRRPLDSFEVYPAGLPLAVGAYTLLEFPTIPGCAAAVAIAGDPAPVLLRQA